MYEPKVIHIYLCLFIALASARMSFTDRAGESAWVFGAIGFALLACFIALLVWFSSFYSYVARYVEALVKMDPDLRNALAFNVPTLRLIAKRGEIKELFEYTSATAEHLRLFLSDSTREHTASKRNWNTSERPRWAWQEIYQYLRDKRMVGEYAVGPDSYPWVGSAYQNLCIYWLTQPVPNLNESDVRSYAADD